MIIEIKNLNFKYKEAAEFALKNVNLKIEEGEFIVVCGESGCGKSTLLKLMKKQLIPCGDKSGRVLYGGVDVSVMQERASVTDIGFVMQNPENQIVTDKVWHELAFGLESLGEDPDFIRRRVAEISGFFGINEWYRKKTAELSGGQKQLLNLASIMVMQPKVLILDEPTSQLDPIAATEFIATLQKINSELGITIILVEHRLEEVYPIAHKIALMNKAQLLFYDTPRAVGKLLKQNEGHKMNLGLPSAVRIFNSLNIDDECPLNVREGKDFLKRHFFNNVADDGRAQGVAASEQGSTTTDIASVQGNAVSSAVGADGSLVTGSSAQDGTETSTASLYSDSKNNNSSAMVLNNKEREIAIEINGGFFRYERDSADVLNDLSIKVYKNELLCILGGNGAGKTTTLKIMSGIRRLQRGKLRIWGKKLKEYSGVTLYRNNIASLPQNPQTLFVKNKVIDDLNEVTKLLEYKKEEGAALVAEVVKKLEIGHLLERHPYDLSGGEQQKAALCKILLMKPRIVLLDEPTKGIDAYSKTVLAKILAGLKADGITIIMVTHDIEFAASYADRCAMFFDGQIVSSAPPTEFFSNNSYYTTAASRISRQVFKNTVTVEQVVYACKNVVKATDCENAVYKSDIKNAYNAKGSENAQNESGRR